MAFAVDGAGHSGSHGLVAPDDGTGIWGSKMVLGERAKGGPLPRPRRRSVRRPAERVKRPTGRDLPLKFDGWLALLAALLEHSGLLQERVGGVLVGRAPTGLERVAVVFVVAATT